MTLLLIVSLVWGFSFGLIKGLRGLDPTAVAAVRLAISLVVFLPLLRTRGIGAGRAARLAALGAVQFGAMYIVYLSAFATLQSYQVALFTITTPLFVALLDAALSGQWRVRYAAAAALSVAGAAVILWNSPGQSGLLRGFVLVQISNLCFAAGQIGWRIERSRMTAGTGDSSLIALPLAGGLVLTLAATATGSHWSTFTPSASQWVTLAYLGSIASGVGFYLWNLGATRVNAGVLAAFNNAKIPLAIACSLAFFGEHADVVRLVGGGSLMALGVWAAAPGRVPAVS
jgi:drug/metabolite transporter (DMT)-like permease